MTTKELAQSDLIGALASGLCTIHCIMTPFLFAVQSCTSSSGGTSLIWWSSIDYIFLVITFFAVHRSGQNSSKKWIKYSLYATWTLLTLLTLNEKSGLLNLEPMLKHIVSFGLIGLHLYNLKFCQCSDDTCCIHS